MGDALLAGELEDHRFEAHRAGDGLKELEERRVGGVGGGVAQGFDAAAEDEAVAPVDDRDAVGRLREDEACEELMDLGEEALAKGLDDQVTPGLQARRDGGAGLFIAALRLGAVGSSPRGFAEIGRGHVRAAGAKGDGADGGERFGDRSGERGLGGVRGVPAELAQGPHRLSVGVRQSARLKLHPGLVEKVLNEVEIDRGRMRRAGTSGGHGGVRLGRNAHGFESRRR